MTGTHTDEPQPRGASKRAAPKFGRFSVDTAADVVTWTDRTFQIFGLDPQEVRPTLAVMSRHQHPDDREAWDIAVARILTSGATFCLWHRIIDGGGQVRSALSIGYPATGADGEVSGFSGFVVDLTTTLRRHREQETTRAVLESAASRDLIEQAKGMLMVIFDLDDTQAFDLLRWHSSFNNIKVREVAATLVNRLVDPDLAGLQPRQRLAAILTALKRGPGTAVAPARTEPAQFPQSTAGPSPSTLKRISNANLPRTMMRAVAGATQSISIADWIDPEQPLVYVNDAFATLTGYTADEILGRNCRFLQGSDTDRSVVAAMRAALNGGREVHSVLRNYRKDGTGFWNEVHLSAVRDDAGRITHYIGYQHDASERVERELTLRRLAYRDSRTGLPNDAAATVDLATTIAEIAGTGFGFVVLYAGFGVDADGAARPLAATALDRIRAALPADVVLSVLDDEALLLRLPAVPVTALPRPGSTEADGMPTAVPSLSGDSGEAAEIEASIWAALTDAVSSLPKNGPLQVRLGAARYPQDGADPAVLRTVARTAAGR